MCERYIALIRWQFSQVWPLNPGGGAAYRGSQFYSSIKKGGGGVRFIHGATISLRTCCDSRKTSRVLIKYWTALNNKFPFKSLPQCMDMGRKKNWRTLIRFDSMSKLDQLPGGHDSAASAAANLRWTWWRKQVSLRVLLAMPVMQHANQRGFFGLQDSTATLKGPKVCKIHFNSFT